MHPRFVNHALLPLHDCLRGKTTLSGVRFLREMYARPDYEIEAWASDKLSALLRYAARHVPYYRGRVTVTESGQQDIDELLAGFPVLERSAVATQAADLRSESFSGELIPYSTGGSSGQPLSFCTDAGKESWHNAYKLYFRSWYGVNPGDPQVDFWRMPARLSSFERLRSWKDRIFLNHIVLPAHDLSDSALRQGVRTIRSRRPALIYGYPTVIDRLARLVLNDQDSGYQPNAVVTTSEMLYPQQRARIQSAFGCPVVNEYGARDAGIIAYECPEGGMHIASGHVHVEVDQPDSSGVGDFLVTNLDGYGFPLIRYRVGDRGAISEGSCACGRPGMLIRSIEGRVNDVLVSASGEPVHSSGPRSVFQVIEEIQQFRIVQDESRDIRVEMVLEQALSPEQLKQCVSELHGQLGANLEIELAVVERIAPELSGKYRTVVSHAQ